MQQRRVRLGDVLDDYCPRERRITNHAVVAMIEDDVKRTRCTTCDAEHEYKHARVPASRRKKPAAVVGGATQVGPGDSPTLVVAGELPDDTDNIADLAPAAAEAVSEVEAPEESDEPIAADAEDEWPVHRPLIRATLPRPEGQAPERKPPDFTVRHAAGRFDAQRNGNRARGNKPARHSQHSSGQSRFGQRSGSGHGSRHGGQPTSQPQQRHGNRQGPSSGHRSGRPGQGGGHRSGQGRGPKRGR